MNIQEQWIISNTWSSYAGAKRVWYRSRNYALAGYAAWSAADEDNSSAELTVVLHNHNL